jgi:SpoVK/Ycf46/Vps4 family AAA+-type ATPase
MLLQPEEIDIDTAAGLKYWMKTDEKRFPWAREETRNSIRGWIAEAENAEHLTAAGEKVYPLLLSGETRCGKTSTMCTLAAKHFGIPCYRMNISNVIGSFMGETTRRFRESLLEAMNGPTALWIIDEVDGVFGQRSNAGSGGSEKEYNAAISVGLSMIENLPQHVMLVATTNEPDILDRAMLARFTHLPFPRWGDLEESERRAFARSHQLEEAWMAESYAAVVHNARNARVKAILENAKRRGRGDRDHG